MHVVLSWSDLLPSGEGWLMLLSSHARSSLLIRSAAVWRSSSDAGCEVGNVLAVHEGAGARGADHLCWRYWDLLPPGGLAIFCRYTSSCRRTDHLQQVHCLLPKDWPSYAGTLPPAEGLAIFCRYTASCRRTGHLMQVHCLLPKDWPSYAGTLPPASGLAVANAIYHRTGDR